MKKLIILLFLFTSCADDVAITESTVIISKEYSPSGFDDYDSDITKSPQYRYTLPANDWFKPENGRIYLYSDDGSYDIGDTLKLTH